jgi:hypothetical protein
MIKKQFTLYLENKPGTLAGVAKMLAKKKINIEGISVSASTDVALVQITVSNAAQTRKALRGMDIAYTVQEVCLLPLKNRPGTLGEVSSALARSGVNINYIYATACQCKDDCNCYAIIGAPDLQKVEAVWGSVAQ